MKINSSGLFMANVLRSVGTLSTETVKKVKSIAKVKLDQHRLQEKLPFELKRTPKDPGNKVDFIA
jgi:hypothetical protein